MLPISAEKAAIRPNQPASAPIASHAKTRDKRYARRALPSSAKSALKFRRTSARTGHASAASKMMPKATTSAD